MTQPLRSMDRKTMLVGVLGAIQLSLIAYRMWREYKDPDKLLSDALTWVEGEKRRQMGASSADPPAGRDV